MSECGSTMWRLCPDVVFREIDGQTVILHLTSGEYFGLGEVGTRIWKGLEQGLSADVIVEFLVAEYVVTPTVAHGDVTRLLGELRQSGLVVEAAPDSAP